MDVMSIASAGMTAASNRFERSAERTANGTGDPVSETVEQIQAKVAFDASAQVVKTSVDMQKRLLDMKV